jgi:hypothetical protein
MKEEDIILKCLSRKPLCDKGTKIMEKFAQILWQLPTGEESSSSGHATPFKVKVNFDIPLFEGLIDVDAINK